MTHGSNLHRRRMMRAFGGMLLALVCCDAPQTVEKRASAMPVADVPAPDTTGSATPASATTSAKPSGSFLSADLPGEVVYSSDVRKTVVGDIEQASATSKAGDASLSITASILPGFVTAVTTDDMLYRKARNELLKTFSAESSSWESCTHAGSTCRKLLYDADDGRAGMARLYLREEVLVVINAIYGKDEEIARRFLASAH